MSRIGLVSVKCLRLGRQSLLKIASRTFLSDAYQCREAWEKRLESPLLKKVNLVHLYKELEHNYSDTENISAVDADIFINAFTPAGFLEDVEDVIQKLRRSSDSHSTPPSSHYATVRLFLDAGKLPTLFKIISDKINYGIFPDQYCMNIMMDTLLKQEKFALAARVATLQMLQEDWDNSLTTRLAMFSCHMYLKNLDQVWLFEEEIVSPEPEPKEVIKVRVRYIRKPFFDDHFDLKDPQLLVGKTLSMFSSKVGGSEQLNLSYKLVGLTLYKKWDEVFNFVDYINKNKKTIYREALQLARMSLEVIPVSESLSEEEAKASKPAKVDPAKVAKEAALKEEHEWKQKTSQKLCELDACVTDGDLLDEMSSLVKEAVAQQQQKDIEQQKELYVQWEEERYKVLKAQQERLRKEETLRKIEEQKKLLAEEEKEIFFFENEDKLDLMIEKNEEIISKFNEKNVKVKDNKAAKDADYVPPEVFKRYS